MASRVLLATLAVPIPVSLSETEKHLEYDEIVREKSRRLANLLGLQSIPTRASLVNDMVRSNTTRHSFSLDLGYLPFTVHGKLEILVGKSNGSHYSIWDSSENMGNAIIFFYSF